MCCSLHRPHLQATHGCGDLIFSSHTTFVLTGVLTFTEYGETLIIKVWPGWLARPVHCWRRGWLEEGTRPLWWAGAAEPVQRKASPHTGLQAFATSL